MKKIKRNNKIKYSKEMETQIAYKSETCEEIGMLRFCLVVALMLFYQETPAFERFQNIWTEAVDKVFPS